jgi:hypothetical protein
VARPSSQLVRFLSLLLIPLRPAALLTVCVLSAVLAVASKAGPFGVPLILILLSWTFKYSFAFLDRLVAGDTEAPVLSVEMVVTSMGEARSLLPLIIVTFVFFASGAGAFLAGALVSGAVAVLLVAFLPAVLAVQAWTGRLAHSVSPRTWLRMIRTLGRDYAWVVGCALALTVICAFAPESLGGVPSGVRIGLLIYAWLALLAVTGGAVHAHRAALQNEIPLVVRKLSAPSPEELERLRARWLDSIYAAWRNDAEANAWRLVVSGIEPDSDALEELRWLYRRVHDWQPPRFSNRVAQELLRHLLATNREGEALRLLRERLSIDPAFEPEA